VAIRTLLFRLMSEFSREPHVGRAAFCFAYFGGFSLFYVGRPAILAADAVPAWTGAAQSISLWAAFSQTMC